MFEMLVVIGTLRDAIQARPAPRPTKVGMAGINKAAAGLSLAGLLLKNNLSSLSSDMSSDSSTISTLSLIITVEFCSVSLSNVLPNTRTFNLIITIRSVEKFKVVCRLKEKLKVLAHKTNYIFSNDDLMKIFPTAWFT